jgi:hypothetical protein
MLASTTLGAVRPLRRLLIVLVAALMAATGIVAVTAPQQASAEESELGWLNWGVKESFRAYIVGPIAQGTITPFDDASVEEDGTFLFPATPGGGYNESYVLGDFGGGVEFEGHEGLLEFNISNIDIEVTGEVGVLVADVVSLPMPSEEDPNPEPVTYEDVEFAHLDLAGIEPLATMDSVAWMDIPATLTEAGVPAFANMYDAGTALDPVSFSLSPEWNPEVSVDPSTALDPAGTPITVTGSGFDPEANLGTRPPLAGQFSGIYVAVARVSEDWRPSQDSDTAIREVIDTRWALPASSLDIVDPERDDPRYIEITAEGTFETELVAEVVEGEGAYAVITYAAGGAVNALQETFTLIGFDTVFSDVDELHPFFWEIQWLVDDGIANGYDDGTFRPAEPVSRQAAAAFLYRYAGEPVVPEGAPTFDDVPEDHPFFDAISWMAAMEITTGYPDGNFLPAEPVSRQAQSAFLYRYDDEPEVPLGAPTFVDVPEDHAFFEEISWMAAVGITTGYEGDVFLPENPVTRQATAAFLYRYDNLEVPEES